MATETVQLNMRVPSGMLRVLDELAAEAGRSRTRYIGQLLKDAQLRRDIERDIVERRTSGPSEIDKHIGEAGEEFLGDYYGEKERAAAAAERATGAA
jgi:hypothetical protein